MLNVHFRVNDATTGKPTPVRLRISDAAGEWYVPWGRYRDFPTGRHEQVGGCVYLDGTKYVYIDGSCELPLPAGVPVTVDISKGPEYLPIRETVTLGAGQMAMRFNLTRWIDTHADGWITADARVHDLNPCDAWLEAAAEGVDFAHVLLTEHDMPSQDGHLYRSVPNLTAFSGQQSAIEKDGVTVAVNTFHSHPVLGHVGLLHSHRPIFPLSFGGDEATDDWSICDWCDQCHRKGGFTVWTRPFEPLSRLVGGEALVALILGKIDAVEYDSKPRTQSLLVPWYRLLNAGFNVPLVGGSGKVSNATALGTVRTYAQLLADESLTYRAWIEAVRAGRCFVTSGPLLTLSKEVHPITASATSLTRFESLELIADGRVIASARSEQTGKRWTATVRSEPLPNDANWIAARCPGPDGFAHTSAVFLKSGEPRRQPDALKYLRNMVDKTREWIDDHGRFTGERSKQHLLELCDRAIERLTIRSDS